MKELPLSDNSPPVGVLLAGGRARRMDGQDKGLLVVANKPLAEWTLQRLRPQVSEIIINANRNAAAYATWGRVVGDIHGGFCGPLAGIHAGLAAAQSEWVLFAPCDSPFLPKTLAAELMNAATLQRANLAIAAAGGRVQPVFMLAKPALGAHLQNFLKSGGRKIDLWYPQCAHVVVEFADADAFANINTPAELAAAAARLHPPR